jgi:hypothetical protein
VAAAPAATFYENTAAAATVDENTAALLEFLGGMWRIGGILQCLCYRSTGTTHSDRDVRSNANPANICV